MQITNEASEFVHQAALQKPVIMVFEQEYKSWCGTRTVTNVVSIERDEIENSSLYIEKQLDNCDIPLLIQENLVGVWEKWKIGLAGWSTFQSLMLLPC